MKLEDQVTSVETSRRLLAADFTAHSGLVWVKWNRNATWTLVVNDEDALDSFGYDSDLDGSETCPAWTAVEIQQGEDINVYQSISGKTWVAEGPNGTIHRANPAEAAAALYLEESEWAE